MTRAKKRTPAVRVSGPLAAYADEFADQLTERGYAPSTQVGHLQVMAHCSRWLQAHEWGLAELTDERVEEYLAERRAAGYSSFRSRASLARLMEMLAGCGAPLKLPTATTSAAMPMGSGAQGLLAGYAQFLREERGVAASTVAAYLPRAGRFVADCAADGDLHPVTAATVSGALLREAGARSTASVRVFAIAVCWLLRYAHLSGLVETDLSAAALPVTGRSPSPLPTGVGPAAAAALLGSCDRRTAAGRRDYAVILTLARLGLRAGEVAGLRLDDLDWRAGQLTVRGKGHRIDRLPLPADVGQAIAGYLHRGRPVTPDRAVFLTLSAPRRALTRRGVSWIVRSACTRAGIPPVGAHALRHGLARQLLRAGAPLSEIGQLLRQQAEITVSRYARVDVDRLAALAMPWPCPQSGGDR